MQWKEVPQDWIWNGAPDHINAEVRSHMGRRNLRQDTVAAVLGIKRQALARRLNGETPWRYSELDKLATAWGITIADLVGIEDSEIRTTVSHGP